MKRLFAILLSACLLAGCAALPGLSSSAATAETALPPSPTAAPQELAVYCPAGALPALLAYADAQGVALTQVDDPAAADLAVLDALPEDGGAYRDLLGDELLAAAASRAGVTEGPCFGLPLGRTLYAYWADTAALTALLGEGCAADLQSAGWEEWEALAETLTAWLAEPAETAVTLNGQTYTLPAEKPDACAALGGVFAAPVGCAPGYTSALLAAGETWNADTLTGPLNGVYSAVSLEWDNRAPDGSAALFTRGRLTDVLALLGADANRDLTPVPFKCELVSSDLSTEEYNLTGLLNYPVLTPAGYLAIPAGADAEGIKAAAGAILWLYGSGGGERALTETLCLVTPWDTAADTTLLGALQVAQVGSGILPGQALGGGVPEALAAAEAALQGSEKRTSAERRAYVAAVLAALGVEDAA